MDVQENPEAVSVGVSRLFLNVDENDVKKFLNEQWEQAQRRIVPNTPQEEWLQKTLEAIKNLILWRENFRSSSLDKKPQDFDFFNGVSRHRINKFLNRDSNNKTRGWASVGRIAYVPSDQNSPIERSIYDPTEHKVVVTKVPRG